MSRGLQGEQSGAIGNTTILFDTRRRNETLLRVLARPRGTRSGACACCQSRPAAVRTSNPAFCRNPLARRAAAAETACMVFSWSDLKLRIESKGSIMEHEELIRIARRRAGMKIGFLIHLAVFVAVNTLLIVVNQQTTPDVSWFAFPLGGWAAGLSIHGLAVFLSGSGLRERMVASELRKLESRRAAGAR
jgi:hypothetical protein